MVFCDSQLQPLTYLDILETSQLLQMFSPEMPLSTMKKSENLTNVKMWQINALNGVLWCEQLYVH